MDAPTSTTEQVDLNAMVAKYVKFRDVLKELDDIHKKKMEPYRKMLADLETYFMGVLNQSGQEAFRCAAGTVYSTQKRSATLADKSAFWDYVMQSQQFDLLDFKANVTAVAEHIKEKGDLPPGVNFTTVNVVGVRRS